MKKGFKLTVLFLVLVLILAVSYVYAQSELKQEALKPGEENRNGEIGENYNGDSVNSGDLVDPKKPTVEIKQDSGTYLGQIDPHSIEIGISGLPVEKEPRAFQLSTPVQGEFASYGLNTGDQVKFSYTLREHGQSTIMIIEKIEKIRN